MGDSTSVKGLAEGNGEVVAFKLFTMSDGTIGYQNSGFTDLVSQRPTGRVCSLCKAPIMFASRTSHTHPLLSQDVSETHHACALPYPKIST